VAESAREVHALGRELYERIGKVGDHLAKLGRSLNGTVGAYNETVGSLETRVLVTARKLEGHGIGGELEMPSLVDSTARPLTAPELVDRAPLAILAGDADAA
jgi:DNA recombination protein RmuC